MRQGRDGTHVQDLPDMLDVDPEGLLIEPEREILDAVRHGSAPT